MKNKCESITVLLHIKHTRRTICSNDNENLYLVSIKTIKDLEILYEHNGDPFHHNIGTPSL